MQKRAASNAEKRRRSGDERLALAKCININNAKAGNNHRPEIACQQGINLAAPDWRHQHRRIPEINHRE